MASPCEVLIEAADYVLANRVASLAFQEAKRIEHKFSRYRNDNILYQINHSNGKTIEVDEETALLLNFADHCYQLSEGLFDITSGVLRKAWLFDGSDRIPSDKEVHKILPLVGWEKVSWHPPLLSMPSGMELDFGGIGKEYAVDRVHKLLQLETNTSFLINFGGDLCTNGLRQNQNSWKIGLEDPTHHGAIQKTIEIKSGALATSGDSKRYLLKKGKRYTHILNPKTGWPIENAPRSVTVAADTTIDAGMLASFALLQGENAKQFLDEQGVQYWGLV
jgi:thiamine biosynthesis lipoprotein